jgi:hypothetical protein
VAFEGRGPLADGSTADADFAGNCGLRQLALLEEVASIPAALLALLATEGSRFPRQRPLF